MAAKKRTSRIACQYKNITRSSVASEIPLWHFIYGAIYLE